MSERVALQQVEEGIVVLSMQDAGGNNAFSEAFLEELVEQLKVVGENPHIRVCVFRGLPEVFCAGAHQDLLLELVKGGSMTSSDIILPGLVLDLPVPTIAAMEGHAVGGGLALGLCCDVLVMARESRYGCSFMNMGFTPGMGTTRLLQFAVGEYLANEMMYGGQMFKGTRFAGCAGVNYVLPRAEVFDKAMHVAKRMAEKPRFALQALKKWLSVPRREAFERARKVEANMHGICFAEPEAGQRIRENYAPAADRGANRENDAPATDRGADENIGGTARKK
ncbi:MAG: polyketide synthase [Pseudomonadota bacterium]